jgi:phospholipid/cholesterol/gamma-HCH transport system permease protein
LNRVGVDSIPLVLMIGIFTGMVVALQTGIALKEGFGAEGQLGTIVGLTLVREMGPVITAFIIAGRVGSSIAAELGTMAVSEEIDALRSMGISPIRYLYVPRLYAMVIMQPILTVFSVLIGIWGGAVIVETYLRFPARIYYERVYEAVQPADIFDGFSKTLVFAALIATISTYMGMTTRHGAEGVGRSTTRAVVASLTTVLIADYLMTRFLA